MNQPTDWLTPSELAAELHMPVQTLYRWRTEGKGPRAHKLGGHVRFMRADVDAWYAENAENRGVAA